MGQYANSIAAILVRFLSHFAHEFKLGMVVFECLFLLNREKNLQRRPDVAFVAYDRWPEPSILEDDPACFDFVPNLAIEVVSPSNTINEIERKILEYFQAGVAQVWVVHPIPRRIYVYLSMDQVVIRNEKDELDGGQVLPGFRLPLKELFNAIKKPVSS